MGENAVIIKSPVGCPAAKTNGYPGVERRLDLIHREDLTYRLDRNVFIPCNTGVIVRDAVCDDDYGEFLDPEIIKAVENPACSSVPILLDHTEIRDGQEYRYSFLEKGKRVTTYRFFYLTCDRDRNAFLIASSGASVKLWINGRLFSVVGGRNKRIAVATLLPGINTIIQEVAETDTNSHFVIRFSDYEEEKKEENPFAILSDNLYFCENFGHVRHSGNHLYHGERFVFSFFPDHDPDGVSRMAELEISDSFDRRLLFKTTCPVGKKQEIDLSGYESDEENGHVLCVTVRYTYRSGFVKEERIPVYRQPPKEWLSRLSAKAKELIAGDRTTDYDKLALQQGWEYINLYGREMPPILAQATILRNNVLAVLKGEHLDATVYQPGTKRVFFRNPLYEAINYYRICLPEDYSSDRKYPLILILSTFEYNDRAKFFRNYTEEPVLAADISMRGMTLGSYIGEASIRYAVEDIFSRYSIDRDRIYCVGLSNGGGGTWAQAESIPDFFAGCCPVSGIPNLTQICNLYGMKVICVSATADYQYKDGFAVPSAALGEHPDYTALCFPSLTHEMLELVCFKKQIWRQMLSARRQQFPKRVCYRTISNRHRKAYWLALHSLEDGCTEGYLEGTLEPGLIRVRCEGITGFTVTVPPDYKGKDFEICVDDKKTFLIEECAEPKLHFIKDTFWDPDTGEGIPFFRRVFRCPPAGKLSKGFGLLDVFFDPLSVIVPDQLSDPVAKTATAYSEPHCNTILPRIYIRYPILSYTDFLTAANKGSGSLVLIDDGSEQKWLSAARAEAPVRVDREGWEYRGKHYPGRYCVLQCIENPWNREFSLLLIQYSDAEMLNRNLFTRKLSIPSYIGGRSPYLNNAALIFDDKGYHALKDFSCEPEDL